VALGVDPKRLGFSVVGVEVPVGAVLLTGKLKAGVFVSAGFWAASEVPVPSGAVAEGNWKRLGFVGGVLELGSTAPLLAAGLPKKPPVDGVDEVGALPNRLGVFVSAPPAPPNREEG